MHGDSELPPGKRVFFADSDDGGCTWQNFRPLQRVPGGKMELKNGEAHGHAVQLADGRVVLAHECRYPYEQGDVRARVSHDDGQTWQPQVYRLSNGHGYAGSVVLDDGTLVTVLGNTLLDSCGRPVSPYRGKILRWRLPDNT